MANDRDYGFPNNRDRDSRDYGRDQGSGRDTGYSGGRDYRPTGDYGARDDRNFRGGGTGYGDRDANYPSMDRGGRDDWGSGDRDYYSGPQQGDHGHGHNDRGQQHGGSHYGARNYGSQQQQQQQQQQGGQRGGREGVDRSYGRAPQGYDYQDRGFIARAGDEVRSWFGDEDAEQRREYDQRHDERSGARDAGSTAYGRDADYHGWRRGQIDALDRDYHEYRQENAKKFESEFTAWRTNRQTQRASLGQVKEHMEVVGSDGAHVGTVDKVRGDRIILTKTDSDAGGRHHSIPSLWLQSVDDKVTIAKSADEAKKHWRDEEESGAMFAGSDATKKGGDTDGRVDLNRSFSGTYRD